MTYGHARQEDVPVVVPSSAGTPNPGVTACPRRRSIERAPRLRNRDRARQEDRVGAQPFDEFIGQGQHRARLASRGETEQIAALSSRRWPSGWRAIRHVADEIDSMYDSSRY